MNLNLQKLPIRLIIILWAVLFFGRCSSQNLINNGSFENLTSCQLTSGSIYFAIGWTEEPNPQYNSADLFAPCASANFSTPDNGTGSQNPVDGSNYAGLFLLHQVSTGKGSEFIENKLQKKLKKNYKYHLSFYLSLAEYQSSLSIGNIGVTLSYADYNAVAFSRIKPDNAIIVNDQPNYLTNDKGWTKLQTLYTANGDEEFLLISDFDTSFTDTLRINNDIMGISAYYYIDHVQLYELTPTNANAGRDTIFCGGGTVKLGTENAQRFKYTWWPAAGLDDPNTAQPTATVTKTTTYYLTVSDPFMDTLYANPSTMDSVTIYVKPIKQLSTNLTPAYSRLCPDDEIELVGGVCNRCQFSWEPKGYLTDTNLFVQKIKPLANINYTFVVWRSEGDTCYLGASVQNKIIVLSTCDTIPEPPPPPFSISIPNVFTPNNDKENDVFIIKGESIAEIKTSIFNRWGLLVKELNGINDIWDGNGQTQGVYYYVTELVTREGEKKVYKGSVELVR